MSGVDYTKLPKTIDVPEKPVTHFLEGAVEKYPDRTALVFVGKSMTYRELDGQIRRFMNALRRQGVGKGDVVAIMSPNCPQAIIAYQAALRIGAIVTQLSPLYVEREIEYQLNDSGAKVVVVANLMAGKVANVIDRTKAVKAIVLKLQEYMAWPKSWLAPVLWKFIEKRDTRIPSGPRFVVWGDVMKEAPAEAKNADVGPDDLALYQYTGGTTGIAKGVELTHRNLVANTLQARAWFTEAEEGQEVFILALPIFHVFGMTVGMNLGLALAAKIVVAPKFDAAEVLKLIEEHKATVFPGVPAMYNAINNSPKAAGADISSIRFCISGAAPLPRLVKEKFEGLTGGKLVEGYGLTEASPVTHCNPLTGGEKSGAIGLALPSTEHKIISAQTGQEAAKPGEVGELLVRGPQVMRGYKDNPEETAKTIIDGWLYTGDMGYIDEDGFVFLMDRKKEMVITGGMNVYPKEVEEILRKMGGVADAAVIGEPDNQYGEKVVAVVVRTEDSEITEQDVIAYGKKNLGGYKVPKKVVFVDSLPKTIIGKVLKRELKKQLEKPAKSE